MQLYDRILVYMTHSFHHIHFVGIKGVGVSALALVAQGLGFTVTGSDTGETFITDGPLAEAGITPLIGFSADHLADTVDLVVVGAAYGDDNPEVRAARERQLTVWTYAELLGYFSGLKKTVAVAGTHGKTTTTSLLTYLLYKVGLQPSWVIGTGTVSGLPAHGAAGSGDYFVTEADDYKRAPHDERPKFLDLTPEVAIITSIEHDHPDMYPTLADCVTAFSRFVDRVTPTGFLVVNGDDVNIAGIRTQKRDRRFVTFGQHAENDYRINVLSSVGEMWSFELQASTGMIGPFQLSLPGLHNVYNATAAIVVALELGVDQDEIAKHLPHFTTVERRYQLVGQLGDIIVIDDYAHHPTSVALTLQTARLQFPDRPLWCLFQAHTYSRTKALLHEFGTAFKLADRVIVTDIFASAREREATITTQDLVDEIRQHHRDAVYVPYAELSTYLTEQLPATAVLVTMGAGDVYKIGHGLVAQQYASKEK